MRSWAAWKRLHSQWQLRNLSLFAKTVSILVGELLLNALIWIIAVIVFTRPSDSNRNVLPLALVAWTTGLRHGLDADHISAIDNATRRIVSVPLMDHNGCPRIRRPVTVGFFFSLGHSTIVIATIVAIAISTHAADNLEGFGNAGSIIGPAISGSFLVLIGCINSFILYKTWTRIRVADKRKETSSSEQVEPTSKRHFTGLMTRVAMPLLRTVDKPWKLYPVGVLFGLGFDTASSIALLSVAVVAQQHGAGEGGAGNASVVLLALLFTAGMTLVDSVDSCLMIWAYAPDLTSNGKPRTGVWEVNSELQRQRREDLTSTRESSDLDEEKGGDSKVKRSGILNVVVELGREDAKEVDKGVAQEKAVITSDVLVEEDSKEVETQTAKQLLTNLDKSASQLSLILTLLSVIIAFAVGVIVLLGLIGGQCVPCSRAAKQQELNGQGGLAGRWWLTWSRANDNFGYIGAAIVGLFTVCVGGYFITQWWLRRRSKLSLSPPDTDLRRERQQA